MRKTITFYEYEETGPSEWRYPETGTITSTDIPDEWSSQNEFLDWCVSRNPKLNTASKYRVSFTDLRETFPVSYLCDSPNQRYMKCDKLLVIEVPDNLRVGVKGNLVLGDIGRLRRPREPQREPPRGYTESPVVIIDDDVSETGFHKVVSPGHVSPQPVKSHHVTPLETPLVSPQPVSPRQAKLSLNLPIHRVPTPAASTPAATSVSPIPSKSSVAIANSAVANSASHITRSVSLHEAPLAPEHQYPFQPGTVSGTSSDVACFSQQPLLDTHTNTDLINYTTTTTTHLPKHIILCHQTRCNDGSLALDPFHSMSAAVPVFESRLHFRNWAKSLHVTEFPRFAEYGVVCNREDAISMDTTTQLFPLTPELANAETWYIYDIVPPPNSIEHLAASFNNLCTMTANNFSILKNKLEESTLRQTLLNGQVQSMEQCLRENGLKRTSPSPDTYPYKRLKEEDVDQDHSDNIMELRFRCENGVVPPRAAELLKSCKKLPSIRCEGGDIDARIAMADNKFVLLAGSNVRWVMTIDDDDETTNPATAGTTLKPAFAGTTLDSALTGTTNPALAATTLDSTVNNFADESCDNFAEPLNASASITTGVLAVSCNKTRTPLLETADEPLFISSPTSPLSPGLVNADTPPSSASVTPVLNCTSNFTPGTLPAPPTPSPVYPSTLVLLEELEELDADSDADHRRRAAATKAIDLTRANLKVEKLARAEAKKVERSKALRAEYDREFDEFKPLPKTVKPSLKPVKPQPASTSKIKKSGRIEKSERDDKACHVKSSKVQSSFFSQVKKSRTRLSL